MKIGVLGSGTGRRTFTRALLLAVALCAAAHNPAVAQSPAVPEGTRVRLLAVGGYRAIGPLLSLTTDSIVVQSGQAGRVSLALGAVRRLEARLPTGSVFRAARRGVLAGAAVGIVAAGALAIANDGSVDATFAVPFLIGTTSLGAVGGAIFLRRYSWRTISLPYRAPPRPADARNPSF
jgi:hypothetical protein